MGNSIALQAPTDDLFLQDLQSLTLKNSLGGGRLLKSVTCMHDEGLVVVKVRQREG